MKVDGLPMRTIWPVDNGHAVEVIDQTLLPHRFATRRLETWQQAAEAIRDMVVRGAPLIGATAAWGMVLALHRDPSHEQCHRVHDALLATRPTAVNLRWALDVMLQAVLPASESTRAQVATDKAEALCDEDVAINHAIGRHGLSLFRDIWTRRKADGATRLNILTHCNAGWLATVDWGTALAPVYQSHDQGIPMHVWVDETRPRNQGAGLTAWELGRHGIPHTVIPDNAGGHLMQHGMVDLCIVGTDRTTRNGDVCNKIGTYLKALAAHASDVPFYVALPSPTIDWTIANGVTGIPIEERCATEVTHITGLSRDGRLESVQLTPQGSAAGNWGFDVTPARYITALITERGICPASESGLRSLFPTGPEKDASCMMTASATI